METATDDDDKAAAVRRLPFNPQAALGGQRPARRSTKRTRRRSTRRRRPAATAAEGPMVDAFMKAIEAQRAEAKGKPRRGCGRRSGPTARRVCDRVEGVPAADGTSTSASRRRRRCGAARRWCRRRARRQRRGGGGARAPAVGRRTLTRSSQVHVIPHAARGGDVYVPPGREALAAEIERQAPRRRAPRRSGARARGRRAARAGRRARRVRGWRRRRSRAARPRRRAGCARRPAPRRTPLPPGATCAPPGRLRPR